VKERRSDAEARDILEEALSTLRSKRKAGEIIF
jgi:plasmid stability protein